MTSWTHIAAELGMHQRAVNAALDEMAAANIVARIWQHDHTIWKPDPTEITNRLGWLRVAGSLKQDLPRIHALAAEVRSEGFTHALLLGMGGSSLAPEVFRKTFGVGQGGLDLAILDSTDPDAVLAWVTRLDLKKTLFIVSTKSGGTVETFSFFKFFYNRVMDAVGRARAGKHFIAITDPGSGLADAAARYHFRTTFLNDPNIGGRYSAMSHFGIVPAVLMGADAARLLDGALQAAAACASSVPAWENPGLWLGAVIGELAKQGRDKLTIVTSPTINSFGDWVEQLIAESTGKEGRGILPVVGETLLPPDAYGNDRLFIHLQLTGDRTHKAALEALRTAGHPLVTCRLDDVYDIGTQMFIWEFATAVAGARLGINPFDQPNVEYAKELARQLVATYQHEGRLPELRASLVADGIAVYSDVTGTTPGEMLRAFLALGEPGRTYVSIHAYVPPTAETDEAMQALRTAIQRHTRMATTTGYGPRFLHSTGQLHKGDGGNGLFIQFTSGAGSVVPIPDEAGVEASAIDFGTLKNAQALGDRQALLSHGRKVIRFDLDGDVPGGMKKLTEAIVV
jgi:glucose-6-phosphate isomerase